MGSAASSEAEIHIPDPALSVEVGAGPASRDSQITAVRVKATSMTTEIVVVARAREFLRESMLLLSPPDLAEWIHPPPLSARRPATRESKRWSRGCEVELSAAQASGRGGDESAVSARPGTGRAVATTRTNRLVAESWA